MKQLIAAALVALGLGLSGGAQASTLSVTFTFTNLVSGSGGGFVTGIARGLTDNATSAATSVELLSNTNGDLGVNGEYVIPGAVRLNSWTLSGGFVTSATFLSNQGLADTPPTPNFALALTTTTIFGAGNGADAGVRQSASFGQEQINVFSGLAFAQAVPEVSTVPLPAAGWMLLAGLVGLGAVARRRGA